MRLYLLLLLVPGSLLLGARAAEDTLAVLQERFAHPPDDARMMMRWWWFGPAVEEGELGRELRVMKAAGIGGVEVQPVYPLALDDGERGVKNLPYLSEEFLGRLRFASETAHSLGMRFDITLGSGWPFGGPSTPVTEAAGKLRCERMAVEEGAASVAAPATEAGEQPLAVFLVEGDGRGPLRNLQQMPLPQGGRLPIPPGLKGRHTVLFFIASRTGMQVKRAGVAAEGFVLDHYERAAIEHHLADVGDKLLGALGSRPPYAVFSDSLEVFGSDWTPGLPEEFRKRRGYDIVPYLPALVGDMGDVTAAVRHDWGRTLTELAEENYLAPIAQWAHRHGTLFRSQTYGVPPVILSSNAMVDLAEGEAGPRWRTFSTARWASSANHLYGRPVTSTETWTWLHSPSFAATPLDMKAEADLHFLSGVNQLIGHGWPYSPPAAGEPGWRLYAAAAFNDHNPWFAVMPDLAVYLQRLSFLLRQGRPANDVAVYLATDDAWADFSAGHDSVDRVMEAHIGPKIIPQILDAGYGFDFIDDRALAAAGIPYGVLVLPHVQRMPLATWKRLRDWVAHGGAVVAVGRRPHLAAGLMEEKNEGGEIEAISKQLFAGGNERVVVVENDEGTGEAIRKLIAPDLRVASEASSIGFVHRKAPAGEIYFLANTSNRPVKTEVTFRVTGLHPQWWDAFTGKAWAAPCSLSSARTTMALELAPYESRTVVFGRGEASAQETPPGEWNLLRELSSDWKVEFGKGGEKIDRMAALASWTARAETRFYSGEAEYTQTVTLSAEELKRPGEIALDFGEGRPLTSTARPGAPGMRTWLDAPVRDAAVVFVNGQRAGSVWHPPYRIALTPWLRAGRNELRIAVGNTAINELAGETPPDYRLLNLRYGNRFTPQDMEHLEPLPSGLLGPVRLLQTEVRKGSR